MATINRRDLISALLGAAALRVTGCSTGDPASQMLKIEGELFSPDFETGHRFRASPAFHKSSVAGRRAVLRSRLGQSTSGKRYQS